MLFIGAEARQTQNLVPAAREELVIAEFSLPTLRPQPVRFTVGETETQRGKGTCPESHRSPDCWLALDCQLRAQGAWFSPWLE